ncbi:MAG: Gp49 family protein [Janthinobacterium lividum]
MNHNDQAIEQEIVAKGKTAPRITPADIEANIAHEVYFTAADAVRFAYLTSDPAEHDARERKNSIIDSLPTRSHGGACIDIDANTHMPASLPLLTFCVLVLRNGFTVTGESACASPENFDAEIGRKVARQNALQKIWPLMGYELKQKLHIAEAG